MKNLLSGLYFSVEGNLTSLMLNDSVTNHTINGSAMSEASRPAEIKHAVRSKCDVKEN